MGRIEGHCNLYFNRYNTTETRTDGQTQGLAEAAPDLRPVQIAHFVDGHGARRTQLQSASTSTMARYRSQVMLLHYVSPARTTRHGPKPKTQPEAEQVIKHLNH